MRSVSLFLLPFTLLQCAKRGAEPPAVVHLNLHLDHERLPAFIGALRKSWKMQRRVKGYLPGEPDYMQKGLTRKRYWFFRTLHPVKGEFEQGRHHSFSLTVVYYRTLKHAQRAFRGLQERYAKEEAAQGRGNVHLALLSSKTLFHFRTDCTMNRGLHEVFHRFRKVVMGGKGPDPRSLLEHTCGGTVHLY